MRVLSACLRRLRAIPHLLAALLLAACSMAESTYISPIGEHQCTSQGGSYYLSKSYLRVKVAMQQELAASGKPGPVTYGLSGVDVMPGADRSQLYCLDYLASPTANDALIIKKTGDNLLEKVTSNAEDQSHKIAENLIQAVFVGISMNPEFDRKLTRGVTELSPKVKDFHIDLTFDPFDDHQTDLANDSLRHAGFCLLLERPDRTFDKSHKSIDSYCDNPLGHERREHAIHEAREDLEKDQPPEFNGPSGRHWRASVRGRHDDRVTTTGVLYRPRVAHSVILFIKRDLRKRGGWELRSRATVMMENVSPVIALGIERAIFATRKTTLLFEHGVLLDVEIEKGSELMGFAQIPLQIAQSITALPANIIQIRIQSTSNRAKLIEVQEKLLLARRNLHTAEMGLADRGGWPGMPRPPGVNIRGVDEGWQPETQRPPTPKPPGVTLRGVDGATEQTPIATAAAGASMCLARCLAPREASRAVCESQCRCETQCLKERGNQRACEAFCASAPSGGPSIGPAGRARP